MVAPELLIEPDPERLARRGADLFSHIGRESAEKRGRFAAALSGGSTPRKMHRLLLTEPYLSEIPWQATHLFWVDERLVPYEDPASNYGAARNDLLAHSPLPDTQIHPMPVGSPPEAGARRHAADLAAFFGPSPGGGPVFDLILLGIGTDGHTASLFPGMGTGLEPDLWVFPVRGGNPDLPRLTLSFRVLNLARHVLFFVSGPGKARAVKRAFEKRLPAVPAARVNPANGRLIWLLDRPAASLLEGDSTNAS
jgi:6-phosphogluconolactonase